MQSTEENGVETGVLWGAGVAKRQKSKCMGAPGGRKKLRHVMKERSGGEETACRGQGVGAGACVQSRSGVGWRSDSGALCSTVKDFQTQDFDSWERRCAGSFAPTPTDCPWLWDVRAVAAAATQTVHPHSREHDCPPG